MRWTASAFHELPAFGVCRDTCCKHWTVDPSCQVPAVNRLDNYSRSGNMLLNTILFRIANKCTNILDALYFSLFVSSAPMLAELLNHDELSERGRNGDKSLKICTRVFFDLR